MNAFTNIVVEYNFKPVEMEKKNDERTKNARTNEGHWFATVAHRLFDKGRQN